MSSDVANPNRNTHPEAVHKVCPVPHRSHRTNSHHRYL
uniref:Uncharacterized protein n=1 Tax=Arundo donax TaxID=35708 RepID=A0A0A9H1I1_ARUDO